MVFNVVGGGGGGGGGEEKKAFLKDSFCSVYL